MARLYLQIRRWKLSKRNNIPEATEKQERQAMDKGVEKVVKNIGVNTSRWEEIDWDSLGRKLAVELSNNKKHMINTSAF